MAEKYAKNGAMTMLLDDFNGMELLWEHLPKRPDDSHVTLTDADIEWIWQSGMVDTKKYPIEAWSRAFDAHKLPDGSYLVSKTEFLEKEIYRYKGEIMIPFDALLVNEGKYTNEGLKELFDLSVGPSCSLSNAELDKFLEGLKKRSLDPSGTIRIDKTAKLELRELIEKYPSPLRRLELMFDAIIRGVEDPGPDNIDLGTAAAKSAGTGQLSQEQIARVQVSSFSASPASITEKRFEGLKELVKKKAKETEKSQAKETTPLTKVKRSRKGMRG